MDKYILDTNTLISYLTDRDLKQQEKISVYFEDAVNFKAELVITDIVINEFVYVLDSVYSIDDEQISEILQSLIKTPGITTSSFFDLTKIFEYWPSKISDYGDGVLSCHAHEINAPIITFDKKLIKEMKKNDIPYIKI